MNDFSLSFQETQTDLEVILEFLEEYYKQNNRENGKKMLIIIFLTTDLISVFQPFFLVFSFSTVDKVYWTAEEQSHQHCWTYYEPPVSFFFFSPQKTLITLPFKAAQCYAICFPIVSFITEHQTCSSAFAGTRRPSSSEPKHNTIIV